MIEPYQWMAEHCETLGLTPDNIGPASADLCMGDTLYAGAKDTLSVPVHGVFRLERGGFYLATTQEHIYVPPTHCAFIQMRSSWARKGLGHKMAGFVDPGFHGEITLELEPSITVEIVPGERIVQIIYQRLTDTTHRPYGGKYQGQTGPTKAYTACA